MYILSFRVFLKRFLCFLVNFSPTDMREDKKEGGIMGESVYRANCILLKKKMWKLFDFVGGVRREREAQTRSYCFNGVAALHRH